MREAIEPALPLRAGVGLKPRHFQAVLEQRPHVGFFEVHAENYMVDGGPLHHFLTRIRESYALSLHGVALSIGGEAPLDREHLQKLKRLIDRYDPAEFSEHLAWSSHGGSFFNDLLPVPYDEDSLARVCDHVDEAQQFLDRVILIENPSTYVEFGGSTLSESQFLREVVSRTGCGLLLDVNNAYVSCVNRGTDAWAYIQDLPLHRVGEIHLAGFARDKDAAGDALLIDDHGRAVDQAVWDLYARTMARAGPRPTLIEWDNNVPELPELLQEAVHADEVMSRHSQAFARDQRRVPA